MDRLHNIKFAIKYFMITFPLIQELVYSYMGFMYTFESNFVHKKENIWSFYVDGFLNNLTKYDRI